MDGGTRSAFARMSQYSMSFANSMYSMENIVHSFSFDLNSRFGENISNQFLATYSKLDQVRGTNSSEFPFIDILDGSGDINNYMALGYELFTYNNAVHNTVWNVKDDVTYYMGNHKLMAGIGFEHQMADNAYMRNGTGYYRYNSVDDFINGEAPQVVCLTYGYNGETNPTAKVQYGKLGIYLQDEWNATERLKLTGGIRFDTFIFNNGDLMTNNAIKDLDYYGKSIDTGKWPTTKVILSPRIGFTYVFLGDKTLKFRGGTGLFQGRLPLVFFTNMPTNGGMVQYQAQLNAKNTDMSQFAGGLVTDAKGHATAAALREKLIGMGYPENITPEQGTVPSSICGVDPSFKMPQVWKTSFAIDYNLPTSFPMSVTAEYIYNKTVNAAILKDWAVPSMAGFPRLNGADNRALFPAGFQTMKSAYVLENTSKGYGWSASLTLNARPIETLSLMASYTHSMAKEMTSLPGSNAASVLNYVTTVEGPNNMHLHNAENITPDRFILSATHNDKHGNHVSIIYEAYRGGYNYSYAMVNDMNGDGYNYDALYIPTDEQVKNGEFRFKTQDDADRFMAFVHRDDYLSKHQGEYAESYSVYNPWVHRVDLGYKHDFSLKLGKTKHTLQLSCDIKNVLNMFNSSWGVAKIMNTDFQASGIGRILKYEGVDAQGYGVYSTPASINGNTKTWIKNHAIGQCWYASVGIKYIFN